MSPGVVIPGAPTTGLDTLRVVTLSVGGRPVEVLDLEDGQFYVKERDSFTVVPPAKKPRSVQLATRYGGQRTVGETHENASISATWRIFGGASADQALQKAEDFIAQVNEAAQGRYIEWKPNGANRSLLFEIRGPGTWTPTYQNNLFSQRQSIQIQASWPVAPLALGFPCDVYDDFAVDSLEDYSFDAMTSADVAIAGGSLTPVGTLTTERRAYHSARGYSFADAQATIKATPGATLTSFKAGRTLRRVDGANYVEVYVDDNGTNSRLRIDAVVGGVRTNRASVNLASRISNGTALWVRGRIEGQVVYAEHFTSEPTPTGTPTTQSPSGGAGYTLSGGEQAALVTGSLGWSWIPQHASAVLDDYRDEPWTYRNRTLPDKISLGGDIPGDAPALWDLDVAAPTGGAGSFALFGWGRRPRTPVAGAVAPFGVVEAESVADVNGWAVEVDAGSRGGSRLNDTTPTSGGGFADYWASWDIDPSTLDPEAFTKGDLLIEVWARVLLDVGLVSPRLRIYAHPMPGTGTGSETGPFQFFSRSSLEYGSAGKLLTLPSAGTVWRFVRLGTLPLGTDENRPLLWKLWINGSLGASTGAAWGLDYLLLVPAAQRASSPTGRNGAGYPIFFQATRRVIYSDLSGAFSEPPATLGPAAGLGGSPLTLQPGAVDLVAKISDFIPDDPTVVSSSEALSQSVALHVSVTPRYYLGRGS